MALREISSPRFGCITLEHLSNPVRTIEELHRILEPGGLLQVRVPYWTPPDWATDPTHRVAFNEYSFDYFDPTTYQGRERPYYSTARFSIRSKTYWIKARAGCIYRSGTEASGLCSRRSRATSAA